MLNRFLFCVFFGAAAFFTLILGKNLNQLTVEINADTNVKYFEVPTSQNAILSWMEVRKGIFPNATPFNEPVLIGQNVTLLIYLKDDSNSYDIEIIDCWAYSGPNFEKAQNKILLTDVQPNIKPAFIYQWKKYSFSPDEGITKLLYTDFRAFKFPGVNELFLNCEVELCYKTCDNVEENEIHRTKKMIILRNKKKYK